MREHTPPIRVFGTVFTLLVLLTILPGCDSYNLSLQNFFENPVGDVPTPSPPSLSPPPPPALTSFAEIEDRLRNGTPPVCLAVDIDLADTGGNGWTDLLDVIQAVGKYVSLDLSACDMSGTEFDPGSADTGEKFITALTLPDGATGIVGGTSANPTFRHFTALASASGAEVATVGDAAFFECNTLEKVDLPAAKTIGRDAFYTCHKLETVNLPMAVTIGAYAFRSCDKLETVDLPAAETIGERAFAYCTALTTVTFPLAEAIDTRAFAYCPALTTVTLPASLTAIDGNPFGGCTALTALIVDDGNSHYKAENGMLFSKDGATLIGYPSASGTVALTGVTTIGGWAFANCTALTAVDLSDAENIGANAFYNTGTGNLTVTLPETAPQVAASGDNIYASYAKPVTVKAPAGRTGYDSAWEANFKKAFGVSYDIYTVTINLTIETE
ncbi:MAG: leucine-rich repeat domain-containing protein [Treponema sp.]|jgi:hypothetical protein|nr:leucine-rich repeat domain-containing protein [Treponema sp.]